MERVGDRQKEMEGHRSTGQGPQRAVVPMEEEEEEVHHFVARSSRFSDSYRRTLSV